MRISDWSSDVCSSDLSQSPRRFAASIVPRRRRPSWPRWNRSKKAIGTGTPAYRPELAAPPREWAEAKSQFAVISGERFVIFRQPRSEEHTSELQSLMRISYAVFCLKKKKSTTEYRSTHTNLSTSHLKQISNI